jgi:sugar phosphate isomerase/epimerase
LYDKTRIGTLVQAEHDAAGCLRQILPLGFESVQLTFHRRVGEIDLPRLADDVRRALDGLQSPAVVSSLGMYGNPLEDAGTAHDFGRLIEAARLFGCDLVCGFAGRVRGASVPDSLPRFREVFAPLARQAEQRGVRIAFENCDKGGDWHGGDWNIAHAPAAWELMFDAVPSDALGLEWEPCHQLVSLVDPLPQLRQWLPKIFHIHGKDANVQWDVLRKSGLRGDKTWAFHRFPGLGDTDWREIFAILRAGNYRGTIDIEGWHDPVFRGELELTGQTNALRYLQACREETAASR